MSRFDSSIFQRSSNVSPDTFELSIKCPQFLKFLELQDPQFIYHSITFESVTLFGPRPGLLTLTCDITFNGLRSKRVVFLRGNAVGALFKLVVNNKYYVLYVKQPRNAVGVRDLPEIVAGMMDDNTNSLAANGVAVKEIKEETGIVLQSNDLIHLGNMYPSAGGCDEMIDLYLVTLEVSESYMSSLIGKQTGELGSDEQITLAVTEYEEFKTMCLDGRIKDSKAMCAIFLSETKFKRGELSDKATRNLGL